MKFRAKMVDAMAIRQFYNILASMAKVAKVCVLRLSSSHFYLIATDSGTGGASVWCQVAQENFFSEYHLEGVTATDPDIYLELQPNQTVQALALLKSATLNIRSLKVKLTRKHGEACLSFVIEMTPSMRQCVHDIPVHPIPRKVWSDYAEPCLDQDGDDDDGNNVINLNLPDLKKLKHIAERYKNLGLFVIIEANQEGRLELRLESDMVKLSTHFKDLEVVRGGGGGGGGGDENRRPNAANKDDNAVIVRVELKRLALFLGADHIGPKRTLARLVKDKLIHMSLLTDEVCMQYFLPAVQA
jgi:HUS1 checkpoint protein